MVFHTFTFFVFFVTFLAFYLPNRRNAAGIWILLIFSNIFYGWWNWKFLGLLWITIIVDYTLSKLIWKTESLNKRKIFLGISILTNLSILAFFKYYNFFIENVTTIGISVPEEWHLLDIVLPVGISFYIFQSISYTFDVYHRNHEPVKKLIHYAPFVCYFPQLVAGPIERVNHLLPQILKPAPITSNRIITGIFLFCMGFFRKAIADTLATFIDPVFADVNNAVPVELILAIFGFGLQIYLDFTGYVDMARGLSRMIGIDLMLNFNAPYLSTSPREFWRRWHISLSQWLRDYLYIPLGGNRYGKLRHISALMLTMILGGLWHGAGFNYIIWGALHGIYLTLNVIWNNMNFATLKNSYFSINSKTMLAVQQSKLIFGWLVTFLAVNYAWLYFRMHTFEDAMIANRKIGDWLFHPSFPTISFSLVIIVLIIVIMEFVMRFSPNTLQAERPELTVAKTVTMSILSGIFFVIGFILLAGAVTQQFIYFQF